MGNIVARRGYTISDEGLDILTAYNVEADCTPIKYIRDDPQEEEAGQFRFNYTITIEGKAVTYTAIAVANKREITDAIKFYRQQWALHKYKQLQP
jgi:hypothetical protein